ncbi:MAG: hypothetical protein LBP79_05130 [Clostridiales bacterium]|jgi:hypothetical protein|nr:hypothetical protein [Clostridiales bacterium]
MRKGVSFSVFEGYGKKILTAGKSLRLKPSEYYNAHIKESIENKQIRRAWEKGKANENTYNFFKTYFSVEEFRGDISEAEPTRIRQRYYDGGIFRDAKGFFEFYTGKDFTPLHLRLDCPLTLFVKKEAWRTGQETEYEFMLNQMLSEFDFMRIVGAETLFQELEFLGGVLVKDEMPFSPQSDFDKLTAHGFDPKSSFRKMN